MYPLADTQRDFSGFVFKQTQHLPIGIKDNGIAAAQRLAIYLNNTRLSLRACLQDLYPVVARLVGEAFFNHLADSYSMAYPPQSPCLSEYGGQFSDYLADFKAAASLPYLPDVARLEWFWHEAYHAADALALDLYILAKLSPEWLAQVRFKLHPSTRLLASEYPLARIWQANQTDAPEDGVIDLNEGAHYVLLYRPEFAVEVIRLSCADYTFFAALNAGATLTEAVAQSLSIQPDRDVQQLLQHSLSLGLLTDFVIY